RAVNIPFSTMTVGNIIYRWKKAFTHAQQLLPLLIVHLHYPKIEKSNTETIEDVASPGRASYPTRKLQQSHHQHGYLDQPCQAIFNGHELANRSQLLELPTPVHEAKKTVTLPSKRRASRRFGP